MEALVKKSSVELKKLCRSILKEAKPIEVFRPRSGPVCVYGSTCKCWRDSETTAFEKYLGVCCRSVLITKTFEPMPTLRSSIQVLSAKRRKLFDAAMKKTQVR